MATAVESRDRRRTDGTVGTEPVRGSCDTRAAAVAVYTLVPAMEVASGGSDMNHLRVLGVLLVSGVVLVHGQANVTGVWQTVPESTRTVTVDLVSDGNQLSGSVEFEDGHVELITDGSVEGRRVHFETSGLLNGEIVLLLWNGETGADEMTIETTIQLLDGREITMLAPRSYVRVR